MDPCGLLAGADHRSHSSHLLWCLCRDIAGLWEAYKAYAHTQEQDADNDADDTRAPLENRLSALADALKENGGQFFGKDYADATDLVLGPRLNHILVVLKHLNVSCVQSGLQSLKKAALFHEVLTEAW